MGGKAESRWYRFGERYGNRVIVSKITRPSGSMNTMYLTLCQCGDLVTTSLGNLKKLRDENMCGKCTKGFYHGEIPSDKTIYDIFFKSKEEK